MTAGSLDRRDRGYPGGVTTGRTRHGDADPSHAACHTRGVAGASPAVASAVPVAPRRRAPARRPAFTLVAIVAAVAMATACGSDDAGDAERFCGEIDADPAAVVAPPIGSDDELDAALAHYRMLADLAPVAIEDEWNDLVVNLETASTVVPGDDESLQRAVARAYATERSAVAVSEWLMANCSIDLGPVATIAPHDRVRPPVDDPETGDDVNDDDSVSDNDVGGDG